VSPNIGDEKPLSRLVDGQTTRDAPFLGVPKLDLNRVRQVAILKQKLMDDLIAGTAAEELSAVRREEYSVKGFVDARARNHFFRFEIDSDNLVRAIATVKHRCETTAGMDGDVYGEVADGHLLADRPQRPLIGEKHRTVGSRAW